MLGSSRLKSMHEMMPAKHSLHEPGFCKPLNILSSRPADLGVVDPVIEFITIHVAGITVKSAADSHAQVSAGVGFRGALVKGEEGSHG